MVVLPVGVRAFAPCEQCRDTAVGRLAVALFFCIGLFLGISKVNLVLAHVLQYLGGGHVTRPEWQLCLLRDFIRQVRADEAVLVSTVAIRPASPLDSLHV